MALHNDEPHLHSLQVSVLLLITSEIVLLMVPAIFVANDFVQYFIIRADDRGVPALVIAVGVGFPPLAIASIFCILALKKGLTLRRPAYLWPYLVLKCLRLGVDITVVCLVVVLDRAAYHLLAYAVSEMLLGICSIDIVWRTRQFLMVLRRRSKRVHFLVEKQPNEKRHSLLTIEEKTSTV